VGRGEREVPRNGRVGLYGDGPTLGDQKWVDSMVRERGKGTRGEENSRQNFIRQVLEGKFHIGDLQAEFLEGGEGKGESENLKHPPTSQMGGGKTPGEKSK